MAKKVSEHEYDALMRLEAGREKRGIFVFFDVLFKKFLPLVNVNFLYILFSLPYILLLFWFSPINATSIAKINVDLAAFIQSSSLQDAFSIDIALRMVFAVMVWLLWGSGPASAGIAYILRNYIRREHAWVWADFIGTVKANFKQSMAILGIDILALYLFSCAIRFYGTMMTGTMYVVIMVAIAFFILVYTFIHFYIYQLMVTYDDKLKQLYKNAMTFSLIKWIPNLLLFVLVGCITLVLFYYIQLFALIPFVFIFGVVMELIIQTYTSRTIARFVEKE